MKGGAEQDFRATAKCRKKKKKRTPSDRGPKLIRQSPLCPMRRPLSIRSTHCSKEDWDSECGFGHFFSLVFAGLFSCGGTSNIFVCAIWTARIRTTVGSYWVSRSAWYTRCIYQYAIYFTSHKAWCPLSCSKCIPENAHLTWCQEDLARLIVPTSTYRYSFSRRVEKVFAVQKFE